MVDLEQLALDAEAGNVDAQYQLGEAYRIGIDVARNLPGAMRWYLRAASRGHVAAQVNLGRLYMQDFEPGGVKRNADQARYWLKRAADAGSVQALYLFAKLRLERDSSLYDPQAAVDALQQAADLGSGPACNDLGILYLEGELVARDVGHAHELLLRGAQLGDAHAQYNLARCRLDGEGIAADARQAEHWFAQAWAQGMRAARLPLALLLLDGMHDAAQRRQGLALLEDAADAGEAEAQFELAAQLEQGAWDDEPDALRALHYYHEAADHGHAEAMFRLATILHRGTDLDRPYPERAAPLLRRLAEEHGHGYAAQILGVMHAQGNGVAADMTRAEQLFELASRLGQHDALMNLALLRAGPSECHDLVEAAKWAMLFDEVASSEESHELLRTLSGLLSDEELARARRRAEEWTAAGGTADDRLRGEAPTKEAAQRTAA